MKKFLRILMVLAALTVPWITQAQTPATTPYTCGFEDGAENANWTIVNGTATNHWIVGHNAVNGGDSALYITNSASGTNAYNVSASSGYAFAYREITFTSGFYTFSFDWRANGESTYDYIRVLLLPSTDTIAACSGSSTPLGLSATETPTGWIPIDGGTKLNLVSDWQNFTSQELNLAAGTYKLVFYWRNDGSGGTQPPAAIDNISVNSIICPQPDNFMASCVHTTSADLNWHERGTATSWVLEYADSAFTPGNYEGTVVNLTDTFYTLPSLVPNTTYYVYLHADCGDGDTSVNSYFTFTTSASEPINTFPWNCTFTDETATGWNFANGTQTNQWVIGGAAFNGGQGDSALYISNDNGDSNIYTKDSISYVYTYRGVEFTAGRYAFLFDWRNNGENAWDVVRAFLVPTSVVLNAGDANGMNANNNPTPSGWLDIGGGYRCSQNSWQTDTTIFDIPTDSSFNLVFFWKNDGGGGSNPPAAIDNVSILPITCPQPTNLAVTPTVDELTVTWTPGGSESSWFVTCDTIIQDIATTNSYTFQNLTDATAYNISVRAVCGDGDSSFVTSGIFRTLCTDIESLPFTENFDSWGTGTADAYPPCWYKAGTYTQSATLPYCQSGGVTGNCLYMYCTSGYNKISIVQPFASSIPVNTLLATFKAKMNSSYTNPLYVGVMTDPTDISTLVYVDTIALTTAWEEYEVFFNNYTDTGRYIAFVCGNWTSSAYVYMDDLSINTIPTCIKPNNLVANNPTSNSMDLSWTERGTASAWNIAYDTMPITDFGSANIVPVTTNPATVPNLNPVSHYYFYVQADCGGGDTSYWSVGTEASTLFDCGDSLTYAVATIGNLTNTVTTTPAFGGWGSSYTQTIYTAGELHSIGLYRGYIHNLAVDWSAVNTSYPKNITIYLGTTTQTGFSNDTDWVNPATLHRVYSDSNNVHPIGWNTYQLDTSFYWDGTSNLVFAFLSNHNGTGTTGNAGGAYATEYAGESRTIYKRADNTVMVPATVTATAASSVMNYRTDLRFEACSDIPSCLNPTSITVTSADSVSISLSWIDTVGSSWQLVYGPHGFNPDSLTTNTTVISNITTDSFMVNNLLSGIAYDFYVRTECSSLYSSWCGPAYGVVGNSFVMPATGIDTITGCSYIIYDNGGAAGDYSSNSNSTLVVYPTQGNVITIAGRMNTEACCDHLYIYEGSDTTGTRLYAFQGIDDNIGPFTSDLGPITIVFTSDVSVQRSGFELITSCVPAPTCIRPTNLTASNATASSVDVAWTERGSATDWVVEYGPRGFALGTGTQVAANSNPFTVTGIPVSYVGEYYVRSVCSSIDSSTYSRSACDFCTMQVPATVPYSYDFETPTEWANWQTSSNNTIHWQRGAAGSSTLGSGSNGMYVTGNDSNAVFVSSVNNVTAYRDIDFGTTDSSFIIAFDAMMGGNSSHLYDGLIVVLVDPSAPVVSSSSNITSPWGNVNNLYRIANLRVTDLNNNGWTHFEGIFDTIHGIHRVAFFWFNQATAFDGEMCKVDNITVDYAACPRPVALQANPTDVSAALSWVGPGSASYEIIYREADSTTNMFAYSNTNSYTLTGLTPLTTYYCWVRKLCGSDTSFVSDGISFETEFCAGVVKDTIIGTGANVSEYAYPVNNYYKYSYTQTIIDSAELSGAMDFSAIAYQYVGTSAITKKTSINIYMGHTTQSTFASNTDFLPVDSMMLVYSGPLNCSAGWNFFGFDTVFSYNGVGNIVVAVDDNSDDYNGSSYKYAATACTGNKTIHAYSDSHNPDPSDMGSFTGSKDVAAMRVNMQLIACGAGCRVPMLTSEMHTYDSATITWTGESTDYEVAVKAASAPTWPAETAVSAYTYTFGGLNPATTYLYRIRQICDSANTSEWYEGTFITDSLPCFAPTNVTATPQGTTADIDWTPGSTESSWLVNVYNSTFNQTYTATEHPYTVTDLVPDITYNVKVSAICGNATDTSDWSTPIIFSTESCDPVTNVTVSSLNSMGATITWTAGENNTNYWKVQYGFADFGQNEGDSIYTTTPSATLTGLVSGQAYDVYVRAICGPNYNSSWSTRVRFTPIGIENVIGGTQLNLYPNPTTGSTTITLSGVQGSVTLTIVDMSGRTVKTETMECSGDCEKKLDVNNLSQGAYFVRVSGENVNIVKKLIVK